MTGKLWAGLILSVALAFLLGLGVVTWIPKSHSRVDADLVLEQIDQVFKLVTVEARFSEIYKYRDYWGYDLSPLRRKALIRVSATVAVGLDLENVRLDLDESKGTVTILNLPDPKILSIETDLDYYDITEGVFNSFSEEDFNRFQREARELIRTKVEETDLYERARGQTFQLLVALDTVLRPSGWTLIHPNDGAGGIPSFE